MISQRVVTIYYINISHYVCCYRSTNLDSIIWLLQEMQGDKVMEVQLE
jgi:hypothetical protein